MEFEIFFGIMIPFIGTALGAAAVFFLKKINAQLSSALVGFAGGVMVAASVWSLLIPAMDGSTELGKWSFVPAAAGFLVGVVFLLLIDKLIPHLHIGGRAEGPKSSLAKSTMLIFAVAIHNLPEGMAVGVIYAGLLAGDASISLAAAFALSVGIAIQNFPEGAIISMPLVADGMSRRRAFAYGLLTAVVEVAGALLTLMMASVLLPILPYLLGFAAGAMIFVVVEELIPEVSTGEYSDLGTISFAFGFTLMMVLDVVFA